MAARYLIFSIFFSLVVCFNQLHGKTIYGKANIIDGDTSASSVTLADATVTV